MDAAGNMMGNMQQQNNGTSYNPSFNQQSSQQPEQAQATPSEDPMTKLMEAKKMLDVGVITEEDYNKLKAKLLGL